MNESEYQNMYDHESTHFFYQGTHNAILQLIRNVRKTKHDRILDVGCGTGLLVKKMGKLGLAQGIDSSIQAVTLGKQRGIKIIKGSITKLPYRTASFDIVTCIDVLCHRSISNDRLALRELRRVLKPSGVLVLRVPAHSFLYSNHDAFVMTKKRYRTAELKHMLQSTGFSVEYITYMNALLFIPSLIKALIEKVLRRQSTSTISHVPLWINKLMISLHEPELQALKYQLQIPIGIEVLTICRKPNH